MLAFSDNSDSPHVDQIKSSLPSLEDYEDVVQVRRSKSLEKIKELRKETNGKRPETAPPNLTHKNELTSLKTEESSKLSSRPNNLNHFSEVNQIHDFNATKFMKPENLENNEKVISWHEHIYKKSPKAPTPHFINDILGWQMSGSLTKRQMLAPEADYCGDDHSDRNNNTSNTNSVHPYQNVESSTLQQLLNLSVTSPTSDHSENYQHPQNYSQTAVLPYSNNYLTDISTPVHKITAPYHYNGKMGRSLSLSETSEDESVVSDQPLNLCVPKSRDSSPNEQRMDKVKKSK